ncbi:unnamed protein product [Leptosia nina]|uniref:LITAF domain-containing protein n=1 Tax=Leptosia nina TaxID=320188 RepID=A0AAV1JIZ4_9NEOP
MYKIKQYCVTKSCVSQCFVNENGEMAQSETDRPYVIQFSESRPRSVRRLSLPNTVYIDIPGANTSTQSQTTNENVREVRPFWTPDVELTQTDVGRRETSQNFVEETIFYDPFDDRRIDITKCATRPVQVFQTYRAAPSLPSPERSTAYRPTQPYDIQASDDGFRLPPLPVLDTPEPPPAYTEIDERQRETPIVRTTPVYRGQQLSGESPRKLIICPCCRMRVYTIVIRESGALTHVIATIVFFLCLPLVFCVYLTEFFKYKNHYCPNCNNMIGYEIPVMCTEMVYTKSCVQNLTSAQES